MLDIVVDGLGNFDSPEMEKGIHRKICGILADLPKKITNQCFITMRKSRRSPVNDPIKARPIIRIICNISNDALIPVVKALTQMQKDFDLRIIDDGGIDDVTDFLETMRSL